MQKDSFITYLYGVEGLTGFVVKKGKEEDFYSYRKNIQGDITHILDNNGNIIVKYIYDAWGNHKAYDDKNILIYDSNVGVTEGYENHIGNLNPFRYRSYYFDTETCLYYLQTRYYDPQTGRFINRDDIAFLDPESINGLNLYAYCLNNPVFRLLRETEKRPKNNKKQVILTNISRSNQKWKQTL